MQQPILNGILESPLDLNGFGFVNVGGLLGTFQAHSAVLDTLAATSPSFAGIDILQIANPGVDSYLTVGSNGVPSYIATGNTVSSTESTTVDGQVVLFNGTTGKVIRKTTATGIAKLASGVLSIVTAPTGDLVGHDDNQILYNKTLSLGTLVSNLGLNFERPSGAGIIQFLAPGGSSSLFCYLPSTSGTLITSAEVSDGYVPTSRTVNGHALSANVTVTPTDLGLVIGTNVQAYSANLSHWAVVNASERVTDFLVDPTLANLKVAVTDETTVGWNLLSLANPDAITFLRLNANNSVSALDASTFRTAIGAGTSSTSGTVTSVSVTTANGVSGSVANATTTPAITLTLGAITPESVTAPNDTPMIVSGGRHVAGPTFLGASITLDPAAPSTHLANITLTPVAGGSVIIASLTSNGLLKTSGGTGTISVDTSSYALTTNPLSQFAATTSAQLRGVISDETGTGALVFAVGPILDGPVIGGSINLKGNLLDDNIASILSITQTVDNTVLTIPDFAGEPDEFTFNVKSQTLSNKTFVAPILGTPASGTLTNCTGLPIGGINFLDTDGTLAANSDAKVASQKAVKTYVTAHTVTNSAGANVVPKSNGTNLIASSIVDDGTVVKGGYGATKFLFDGGVAGLLTIGDIDGTANGTKIVIDDNNTEVDITGELFLNGNLNPSDGSNITFGTSTGSQLGTTTSDKIGFWSAAPVVQNTGWGSITNVTSDKVYNANSTTLDEVADVLGTLIAQLVTYGILGA